MWGTLEIDYVEAENQERPGSAMGNEDNTLCGLKTICVCITNQYEQLNVDKIIRELHENVDGTGIEIRAGNKTENKGEVRTGNTSTHRAQGETDDQDGLNGRDELYVGDTEDVDIGIGRQYRGKAPFVTFEAEDIEMPYLNMVWSRISHQPMMIAETETLLVREMTMEDLDDLYELYDSLKDCTYVEPLYERAEEEVFTQKYIENMYAFFGYGLWLVFLKEDGNTRLVARVGIENREIDGKTEQELGYLVHKDFWRKNIATESCEIALYYAEHVLGLDRIFACIDRGNEPSIKLAEKLGFSIYENNVEGMNVYMKELR